ncbi:MAG: peptidase M16 [Arachnia propionica]|nr:MAG: peptidase M16 [Arachnia propionica]
MSYSPLELETHQLANGLEIAVHSDPAAPGVAVNLWYEVGSFDEDPERTGLAHLFEHLMFAGSANVGPSEHMALIEQVGGTVNATTATDRTNYFETVPPGALELALWLEADRLGSLDLQQATLDAQRNVVSEEYRQRYENRPYSDALHLLYAQHFPAGHPYAQLPIGDMDQLAATSVAEVQAFFDRWYTASNARLVLAGAVQPTKAFELVEQHFGPLPRRAKPAHQPCPDTSLPPGWHSVHRQVPHELVYLSWPAPPTAAEQFPALELLLDLLTDGQASLLHRRLVRQAGIANNVYGMLLPHHRGRGIAAIIARPAAGVSPQQLVAAIRAEIEQVTAPSELTADLKRAIAQYERSFLAQLATVAGRADAINDAWLTYGAPEKLNTVLPNLLSLTADDVAAAAIPLTGEPHVLHYLPQEPA